jgi:hypothetical protein
MGVVIFGGDRLGNIPQLLQKHGFHLVQHVTGRKKGDLKTDIHREAEGVLVFIDFLNHTLAGEVKAAAKRKGIQVIFVRRSWSQLKQALATLKIAGTQNE